ncbi:MAG: serine hydrolase, partial [Bacteroidota bacterium]
MKTSTTFSIYLRISKLCIALALILSTSYDLTANNGKVGLAYPIMDITIDGDFSDWPKNIPHFKLEELAGWAVQPTSKMDTDASFRMGYNIKEQAIYLAVEVYDEANVTDSSGKAAWNTHDVHHLYLDIKHKRAGSGALGFLASNDCRLFLDGLSTYVFDPDLLNYSWDNITLKIRRTSKTTNYEWRIDVEDVIQPGQSIGFDYEVLDKDPEDGEGRTTVLAWGQGVAKVNQQNLLGDIILVKENHEIGKCSGQLKWQAKDINVKPSMVRLTAVEAPNLWIHVPVDTNGLYSAELPIGQYEVSIPYNLLRQSNTYYKVATTKKIIIECKAKQNNTPGIATFDDSPKPKILRKEGVLKNFKPSDKSDIDEVLKQLMDYYEVPGASLAIIKNAEVVYQQTYGYANFLTKDKVEQNTLFEAASVTKPVFGFAVCRLAEKGIIDLDKPLHEYLPFEEIAGDERYKLMTARHVLNHTSGLPNWGMQLIETPGTKFGYSGEGFEYLKRVVMAITGKDIEQIMKEEVLIPINMSDTY